MLGLQTFTGYISDEQTPKAKICYQNKLMGYIIKSSHQDSQQFSKEMDHLKWLQLGHFSVDRPSFHLFHGSHYFLKHLCLKTFMKQFLKLLYVFPEYSKSISSWHLLEIHKHFIIYSNDGFFYESNQRVQSKWNNVHMSGHRQHQA